jgi:hypothetical protein
MARVGGYAITTGLWGEIEEHDTFTCPHCNGVCIIHPGSGKQRGYCFLCNAATCGKKQCNNGCSPFMKKIEAMENRYRLHKVMERGYDT